MSWLVSASFRIYRGGSWGNDVRFVQITSHGRSSFIARSGNIGLRFVRRAP